MKDCFKLAFAIGFGLELGIFCAKWLSDTASIKIKNHKNK